MKRDRDYYMKKVVEMSVAEATGEVIRDPFRVHRILESYGYADQEHFLAILLNGAHKIIETVVVTKGILNKTMIHPREVFRPAIEKNAAAVILAHNHPSQQAEPSEEDRNVTGRMVQAGKLIGIPVLDHIIITRESFYSFQNEGTLEDTI